MATAHFVRFVQALVSARLANANHVCRISVVTCRAAFEVEHPRGSALWGAVRSMAMEVGDEAKLDFRLVDLGDADDLETLGWLARRDLREREIAVRENRLWAPRVSSIRKRYAHVAAGDDAKCRLTLDNPGQIAGLQMKTYELPSVGPNDVKIEIEAAALNFRDVMVTLGLLPAPAFLQDLENGTAKRVYRAPRKPDVTVTPLPRFDLIDMNDYYSMCLQFSRGCPFDCEFCDITKLYGRVSRTKTPEQMVAEFDHLYELGWRGPLFLVDDNFIGNKREVTRLLPAIAEWQRERGHPFALSTEASVNLVRMNDLMDIMIEAGFDTVFLGIETPNPKALKKMKKPQNLNMRDDNYLFTAVRKTQRKGIQVQGGFILGLDEDDESAFDAQIDFIQEARIPIALVGLLTALKDTNLWGAPEAGGPTAGQAHRDQRHLAELQTADGSRHLGGGVSAGHRDDLRFDARELLRALPNAVGAPQPRAAHQQTGERARALRGDHGHPATPDQGPASGVLAVHREGLQDHPRMMPLAIRLAANGHHCKKFTRQQTVIREFKEFLDSELAMVRDAQPEPTPTTGAEDGFRRVTLDRADARRRAIPEEFRYAGDGISEALAAFELAVDSQARPAPPTRGNLPVVGETPAQGEAAHV